MADSHDAVLLVSDATRETHLVARTAIARKALALPIPFAKLGTRCISMSQGVRLQADACCLCDGQRCSAQQASMPCVLCITCHEVQQLVAYFAMGAKAGCRCTLQISAVCMPGLADEVAGA